MRWIGSVITWFGFTMLLAIAICCIPAVLIWRLLGGED